jgi:hypothetical protein
MLAQNINPKVVKEILGHSDIRVTLDTYSHVLPSVHKQTATQYGECCSAKIKKIYSTVSAYFEFMRKPVTILLTVSIFSGKSSKKYLL